MHLLAFWHNWEHYLMIENNSNSYVFFVDIQDGIVFFFQKLGK